MPKVWLVTGSARGLGRSIVEAALAAGDAVLATARSLAPLEPLVEASKRRLQCFSLDVTNAEQAAAAVRAAVDRFGALDVLVNNAGYGHILPFEQMDEADFRAQVETNLFGVVNLIRAAMPLMRRQRSGHIINISSIGGRTAAPGLSAYQAAKWAVSGLSEVLSLEAAPFGVKVISLEPGGMRTEWGAIAGQRLAEILPDYEPTVGAMLDFMPGFVGREIGDPVKIAKVVVDLSRRDDLPAHLILGSDAVHVYQKAETARQKAAAEWLAVSQSVDFEDGSPNYLKTVAGMTT